MSSLAEATHKMVCRSPAFPKIPRFGVRALPHRDQNCEHKRRRSVRRYLLAVFNIVFKCFEHRGQICVLDCISTMDIVSKALMKSEGRG